MSSVQVGNGNGNRDGGAAREFDAVVVGASLAGCATAIMLGRAGARVALVEQRPDEGAYKKVCSHYIQSSAVATLRAPGAARADAAGRRGALARAPAHAVGVDRAAREALGAERREPAPRGARPADPPGRPPDARRRADDGLDGDASCCATARPCAGRWRAIAAAPSCGFRGSWSWAQTGVARAGQARGRTQSTHRHGRIAYGGYFEGPPPKGAPDASFWLLDPDMYAAFPTDSGLTFYAAMPTKNREEQFREDPAKALVEFIGSVPDASPIRASRCIARRRASST